MLEAFEGSIGRGFGTLLLFLVIKFKQPQEFVLFNITNISVQLPRVQSIILLKKC